MTTPAHAHDENVHYHAPQPAQAAAPAGPLPGADLSMSDVRDLVFEVYVLQRENAILRAYAAQLQAERDQAVAAVSGDTSTIADRDPAAA